MQNTNKYLQNYQKVLSISQQIKTKSQNKYQLCKRKSKKNDQLWPIQFILKITRIQITEAVINRVAQIKGIANHQNLIPIQFIGYSAQKSLVYALSQYFHKDPKSQAPMASLEIFFENKQQFKIGTLNHIFYQVVRALHQLEKTKINHLRLNPSAILIKFPQSRLSVEGPVVRVCDYGLGPEKNYSHCYCLHKDLVEGLNPYGKSFENNCKYDIWALGAIIYYALKQKMPFYLSQPTFLQSKGFKPKYLSKPQSWLKQIENNFRRDLVISQILIKCWGLNSQPIWSSFKEILQYYEERQCVTSIQKLQIKDIFTSHFRLMYLYLQIYMILKQQLLIKTTILWKCRQGFRNNQNNQKLQKNMKKLSIYLFKLCQTHHFQIFYKLFLNRSAALPFYMQRLITDLQLTLKFQRSCLNQSENINNYQRDSKLKQIIQPILKMILSFMGQLQQIKGQWCPTILKILKFFIEFKNCQQKWQNINKDTTKNIGDEILVFYEDQIFIQMAEGFGFRIPKDDLFESTSFNR